MHGSAIFHDGKGTLHHLNGIAPAGAKGWAKLALLHRSSADIGIAGEHLVLAATDASVRRVVADKAATRL